MELYSQDAVKLGQSTGTRDREFIDHTASQSGYYYLRVYYGNEGNSYDLIWNTYLSGLEDYDGDGLPDNIDSDDDNDGLLDTIELFYGLNPKNSSDALEDWDNDGFSNKLEISRGTDIKDANSKPHWTPIIMGDIMFVIPV